MKKTFCYGKVKKKSDMQDNIFLKNSMNNIISKQKYNLKDCI